MHRTWKHFATWKKLVIPYDSISKKCPEQANLYKQSMAESLGLGVGRNKEWLLMGMRFLLGMKKIFQNWLWWWLHNSGKKVTGMPSSFPVYHLRSVIFDQTSEKKTCRKLSDYKMLKTSKISWGQEASPWYKPKRLRFISCHLPSN